MLFKSFFVGKTPLFPWPTERRRAWRWLIAVAKKGDTEPLECFIAVSMLMGGVFRLVAPDAMDALPWQFSIALIIGGINGIAGLATRKLWLRQMFSFGCIILRGTMMMMYLLHNWHNPIWVLVLNYGLASVWIATRLTCYWCVKRRKRQTAAL